MLVGCKLNLVQNQGKHQWPPREIDWAGPARACLRVSCGGTGQQCTAAGTGALAAAVLGDAACGLSPRGGGSHQPHHRAEEQTIHKPKNNYTREVLTWLWKHSRPHNRFPNLGIQQRDWEPPENLTWKASGIWLQNFHKTWGTETAGGRNKILCTPGPRRKEQWPHKRLSQICLWVSRSLWWRRRSTVACHRVRGTEYNSLGNYAGINPSEGGHP